MAYDVFLDIKGVEGESTAKGFEKKIEIYSFSWGASNPTTVSSAKGGISAGKATVSTFNIMKKLDKSSNELFAHCLKGEHFESGKVTFRKAGGAAGQQKYMEYTFNHLMVESIQWSGSSGGDDTPTESVSFAYANLSVEYFGQDMKGATKPLSTVTYDLTTVSK